MKFTFSGKAYEIEFRRVVASFHLPDPFQPNVKHVVVPKSPNKTIVRLVEYEEDSLGVATPTGVTYVAETVCKGPDRFNLEEGRVRALRILTRKLNPGMRKPLWDAYIGRPRHQEWVSKTKLSRVLFGYGLDDATLAKVYEAAR